jgi:hypothetical protein
MSSEFSIWEEEGLLDVFGELSINFPWSQTLIIV